MSEKVVWVTVKVPSDKEAEFLEVMKIDVEGSRAEEGCLRFDLIKGEEAGVWHFYEVCGGVSAWKAMRCWTQGRSHSPRSLALTALLLPATVCLSLDRCTRMLMLPRTTRLCRTTRSGRTSRLPTWIPSVPPRPLSRVEVRAQSSERRRTTRVYRACDGLRCHERPASCRGRRAQSESVVYAHTGFLQFSSTGACRRDDELMTIYKLQKNDSVSCQSAQPRRRASHAARRAGCAADRADRTPLGPRLDGLLEPSTACSELVGLCIGQPATGMVRVTRGVGNKPSECFV